MLKLTVNASRKYDITITNGMEAFFEKTSSFLKGENIAVVCDENVDNLYPDVVTSQFANKNVYKFVIPAGEKSKSTDNFVYLLNCLAERGFTREDSLVTFGGGVVGDLGAFVASCYMRGITLLSVPTSLLAMVDSSVGGKTAVNLSKGKNLCGTFWQPSAVYINTDFLNTLPKREMESGMGEIIKYAWIAPNAPISISGEIDEQLIYECLKIKAEIVENDERESGKRKLLNFGHTVGHAIEKLADFSFSHGLCVAKGILCALKMSRKVYSPNGEYDAFYNEAENRLLYEKLDFRCSYSAEELTEVIISDKKRKGNTVDFVLINPQGNPEIVPLPLEKIKEYLS